MSGLMTQRFRATVVAHIDFYVDADDAREAEERARRFAVTRPRIRASEIQSVTTSPLPVAERLTQANLHAWQETEALRCGTVTDRQRWQDGCLPEEDLLRLAREELFRPLALVPRRPRRGPSMVHPGNDMAACVKDGAVPMAWSINPDPDLSATQWSVFRRVLVACETIRAHRWMTSTRPESVRLAVREHRGECRTCQLAATEVGVLVEIDWAGRLLTREYVL